MLILIGQYKICADFQWQHLSFFMQQTDYTITNDNVGENCVLIK